MRTEKDRVVEFLDQYQMNHQRIMMAECCDRFLGEMERGLEGNHASLAMFPTFIEAEREIPLNERVIVIDAGGTNLRTGMLYFDDAGQAVIENFTKRPMPGSTGVVSKSEFFDAFADALRELADQSDTIGFCFSYPVQMLASRDGRMMRFSKQIQAKGVEGELLIANLRDAMQRNGLRSDHRIALLNDTVATLLAGKTASRERAFDSYVGFILGTGTNSCYVEQNANIRKEPGLDAARTQIINVEAGGFGLAPTGQIDRDFDRTTVDPGYYTFEKMISGRYLGGISHQVIRQAAQDGLFTPETAERLGQLPELNTFAVNQFLHQPDRISHPLGAALSAATGSDRVILYLLLDSMVERAAKLAAVNLAAMVLKSGCGTRPDRPVCLTADGTTFYQMKGLRFKTEYYLQQFLTEQQGRFFEIVSVDNAPLIGAAIAGLIN